MTMTKADMIIRIYEKTHTSKEDAVNLVEGTFEIIKASLERGEPVKITGFGSFVVRSSRAKDAIPQPAPKSLFLGIRL